MARLAVSCLMAALVVFCVVQDRVTAAGARQYVALQRVALTGAAPPTTIDAVMRPAIRQSVRDGLIWSAPLVVVGIGAAAAAWRRP